MTFHPTRTVYRVTALYEASDTLCRAVALETSRKLAGPHPDQDIAETERMSAIHLLARACSTACKEMIPGHLVATPLAYYDSFRHGGKGPSTERMPPDKEQIMLMREAMIQAERRAKEAKK